MIKEKFNEQLYRTDKFTGHSYLDAYEEVLKWIYNERPYLVPDET